MKPTAVAAKFAAFLLWLALALVAAAPAHAIDKAASKTGADVASANARIAALSLQLRESAEALEKLQSEHSRIEIDYTRNFYDYSKKKNEIIIDQFVWQKHASEVLLWVVILLVVSGIGFSGYQLVKASSTKDLGASNSVEIELTRIKITSSVVGLVVLVISVVFFYLFLIEVYRMKVIDLSPSEQRPAASAPAKADSPTPVPSRP